MGYFKTAILLAAMTALFMGVGYLVGGQSGMLIAFFVAAGMNLFAYWNSDKMVLSMYGARPVDERSAPELYGLVAQLARQADLPMPKVFVMDNAQPNAFATGRNPDNAAVAVASLALGVGLVLGQHLEGRQAHQVEGAAHRQRTREQVRKAARDGHRVPRADRGTGGPDLHVLARAVLPDGGHHLLLHVLVELVLHPHPVLRAAFLAEPDLPADGVARVDLDPPRLDEGRRRGGRSLHEDVAAAATWKVELGQSRARGFRPAIERTRRR